MSKPKYYFVRYQVKGKTYYKNQNGQRASADSVKRSKKKVFDLIQIGPAKGELLDKSKKRIGKSKRKKPKSKVLTTFIFGQSLGGAIAEALDSGKLTFISWKGKEYQATTGASQKNLLLFVYSYMESFYRNLKPVLDSPLILIGWTEGKKDNFVLANFDTAKMRDEQVMGRPKINAAWTKFNNEANRYFNDYFKK